MSGQIKGWIAGTTIAVLIGLGILLRVLVRRGLYPRLPELDEMQADTARDRFRYHAANVAAFAVGLAAAAGMYLVPPQAPSDALWRASNYDLTAARLLGPFFFGLAVAGMTAPFLCARWIDEGPLLHILSRSASRQFLTGLDLRPVLRWVSRSVAVLAVLVHSIAWIGHVTMDERGIRWRDWPWQSEQSRAWTEVREVRLVDGFTAMTGNRVERLHLALEFADGEAIHVGKRNEHGEKSCRDGAAIAAERAGLVVRQVEQDEGG